MKSVIRSLTAIFLCCVLLVPNITVFARTEEAQTEWEDVTLTEEEFNNILTNNINNSVQLYASGLISGYSLGINYNGSKLIVVGKTLGIVDVVKCGFKKVVIQRRASSTASWSDYLTYENLYSDSNMYVLSKNITVPSGYYYRVTCKHYAKKNILSTQTINNTSNIVYI